MQIWSNGVYKSVEHRAVTNARKARMSIAMFFMADDDAEIGPVDTMLCDNGQALYKRIKYVDYIRRNPRLCHLHLHLMKMDTLH
ncbi:Protein SRG1 [Senna tora]|uniref:Protein SRG1 n=1 Tax=Senna tora TaxID=362788 RepID=A0A834SYW0_9FABA|nr:Protein SRG1 [Senna tora]